MSVDDANRQSREAQFGRMKTLQKYQRLMSGLLNDHKPALGFKAVQPLAEVDGIGVVVLQISEITRVARRHDT